MDQQTRKYDLRQQTKFRSMQRKTNSKEQGHDTEWVKYYRLSVCDKIEALHAHFITHRYPRHSHDHLVIGLVETGAQAYWYRGKTHVNPAGHIFLVDFNEPHTGEPLTPTGYVYRTLYVKREVLARVAGELGTGKLPHFKTAVLEHAELAAILMRVHQTVCEPHLKSECESLILRALAILTFHHADLAIALKPAGHEPSAVRTVREYLDEHFAEEVTLSDLAALVSFSPFYLARTFQRELGLPPHAY